MNIFQKAFPRVPQRINRGDAFWDGRKKPFAIACIASSVLLQVLFLVNFFYLYGSLYRVSDKVHSFNVLYVDFDGGVIGKSVQAAASGLASDSFPTIYNHSSTEYASPTAVYEAVRKGDYWAGVYTHSGASQRLTEALQGNNAAALYNTSNVISYVWNEARYAAPSDGYLESDMVKLVEAARIAYNKINGTGALQTMNQDDPSALQAFLYPWSGNSINIKPTTQGDRVLYNTVTMVLPIIMQFFLLMAINGISAQFGLFQHLPVMDNGLLRILLSSIFTFIGSLCLTGVIWAYKESWAVGGGQFMCTWLILWLYMHINFLVMDVATGFIPQQFLPFFVLTWVVMNVTSTIFPFELSAGFYRLGYVLPAHETWQVLVQIFSGGAVNRLYQALPILFVYEIVLLPVAKMAMHHRCLTAVHAEQRDEEMRHAAVMKEHHNDDSKDGYVARENSVGEGSTHELTLVSSREAERIEQAEQQHEKVAQEYWPAVPVPFGGRLAHSASQRNLKRQTSQKTLRRQPSQKNLEKENVNQMDMEKQGDEMDPWDQNPRHSQRHSQRYSQILRNQPSQGTMIREASRNLRIQVHPASPAELSRPASVVTFHTSREEP